MRALARVALSGELLGASSCAAPHVFLTVSRGFAATELVDDCAVMAARIDDAGIWRPTFLFYGRRVGVPYPVDELWVLELTTLSGDETVDSGAITALRLRCDADERELAFLACPAGRVFIDPAELTDWRGRGQPGSTCTLRIEGSRGEDALLGFESVFLRGSLRDALKPLTASDRADTASGGAVADDPDAEASPRRDVADVAEDGRSMSQGAGPFDSP